MNSSPTIGLHQASAEQAEYLRTDQIESPHFMEVINTSKPARIKGGELLASEDETSAKVRKPYTITKQRERWTEEEHQKFIEALRLYGRAWRRIEEHIGTKTAVQIRSHAQKFFSKLEREASVGFSAGIAQDIEIPPPRPKRKPSHPYPLKAGRTFSGSPSAFEEESKSPTAVCSAFIPSRSHLTSSLQDVLIKNGTPSPYCNQSISSMLGKNELHRRLDGSTQMSGSSTSLKLFGQTLVFPLAERAAIFTSDTLQANTTNLSGEPAMVFATEESQSKGFEETQVLSQVESSFVLSDCKNEAEAWERFVAMVRSQDKFGVGTSTDSSKTGTSNACLGETSGAAQNTSPHCQHVSSKVSVCADKGEDCPMDRHKGHPLEKLSSLIDFKGTNAAATILASISNARLTCPPFEPSAIHYMRSLQGPSSNVHSQADSGSLESLFLNAWHILQAAVRQALPTSAATTVCPDLIPGSSFHNKSSHDTGVAAAVASFTLAAASSWWALQGVVSPASIPSLKRERVYNPVAVVAGEKPPFLSMCGLKTDVSVEQQHFNALRLHKAIGEHSKQEQKANNANENKDEQIASIKHQVSADDSQQSSHECYSSSESAGTESDIESRSFQAEAEPAKKRIKTSSSPKVENMNEGSGGSFSGSNALPSNSDCERQEEYSLSCFSKAHGDMQESIVCNVGRPAVGLFRENADCNAQQFCCSEDNASHSMRDKDPSAGQDVKCGYLVTETADGNKGCTFSGINECLLVDAGKTNPKKLARQAASHHSFKWKQRKQDQYKFDSSLSQAHSVRDMECFSMNSDSMLHLAESKSSEMLLNKHQYPCSIFIDQGPSDGTPGGTCPNFFSLVSQENVSSKAEHEDCAEVSVQVESTERFDDVVQEQEQKSIPVKTEGLNGCTRYSGAGFVPYRKFLEDGKTKVAINVKVEHRDDIQARNA